MKVCKFGGTSMASADSVRSVTDIIKQDEDRRYIVVSAPGKRFPADVKVTDALYAYGKTHDFEGIAKRYTDIADAFGVDIAPLLQEVGAQLEGASSRDFAASRGEYLCARMLAEILDAEFVDAAGLICFDNDGELMLAESCGRLFRRLSAARIAVLPGFYGTLPDGNIKTFSRGGSDITGAIVAAALDADLYENWTDVDGFLSADPRIVKDPCLIDRLSYKELRELAYMGAEVLHPECIFPVRHAGIPINVKNTFNPAHPGTMIVADAADCPSERVVTGVAGKKGFTIINIEKDMMNSEIGFARRVLSVLEEEQISFEHVPSGIDTLSIVIRDEYVERRLPRLLLKLQNASDADNIEVHSGLALIATVGRNMASRQGTAAALFKALAARHINVRMIDQGSSELNIIIGVDTFDYEKAITAIYHGFFK